MRIWHRFIINKGIFVILDREGDSICMWLISLMNHMCHMYVVAIGMNM